MIKPMDTAPKKKAIIIVTRAAAHQAEWDSDPRFENFWSVTADRALTKDEALGWMSQPSGGSLSDTNRSRGAADNAAMSCSNVAPDVAT